MLTVGGIAGLPLNPNLPTAQSWIGVSRGAGATDAGPTPYANFLGQGLQPGPTSSSPMIYQRGTEGTFAPNINGVIFTPNGFGNYDFTVY